VALARPRFEGVAENEEGDGTEAEFLSSFVDSLEPVGLLDRFKVAGVVAS
jgi:hypothetical protein